MFDKKLHNAAQFTYPMARIPLVLNFSSKWEGQNTIAIKQLKEKVNNVFSLDLMFETFLGLADVQGFKYNQEYNFGHSSYKIDLGNAVIMKTGAELDKSLYVEAKKFKISDDPFIIAQENLKYLNREYPNKISSVYDDIKSKVYADKKLGFTGLEFNLTIPDNMMGHYPEISLMTTIEQYLSWKPLNQYNRLWFDVKTMTGSDIQDSFLFFEELNAKYDIKRRSLIESWDDGLVKFSDNGWHTSYYVHQSNWPECKNFTENNIFCAKSIVEKIKQTKASSISFFVTDYPFVKRYLEPLLPDTVKYNTFGLPSEYSIYNKNLSNIIKQNVWFNDKRIETILLGGSSDFGLSLPTD